MSRLRLIAGAVDGPQPVESDERLPDGEALDAYSRTVTAVAERLRPSVANLRVGRRTRWGRREGGGSAVVITPDGYMLTSAHVVDGSERSAQVAGVAEHYRWPRRGVSHRSSSSQRMVAACKRGSETMRCHTTA